MNVLELERRIRDLTQTAAAKRYGLSRSSLAMIENEKVYPWPAARKRISEALNVPEGRLFGADGWPIKIQIGDITIQTTKSTNQEDQKAL